MQFWGLLLLLLLMPVKSYSATQDNSIYSPGTIGYLYEDCKVGLKSSTTDEFFATYCGRFYEGLSAGLFVSNYILLLEPDDNDPCANDKEIAHNIINSRFCLNADIYGSHSDKPKKKTNPLPESSIIFYTWLKYNEKNRNLSEIINADIVADFMKLATDSDFCSYYQENRPVSIPLEINPALLEADWKNQLFDKSKRKWIDTYNQCQTDILSAAGSSIDFKRTRCGAEIIGYLTGLNSTAHLQSKRPNVSPSCQREINALFDQINLMERSCVTEHTDPLYIAKIFVKTTESAIAGKWRYQDDQNYPKSSDFLYTTPVTGYAGHLPIWYGEVCKRKESISRDYNP